MSGDAEQEYFSDGIAEDIITDLSKVSGLFVIARNSSFTYKGRTVDEKRQEARAALQRLEGLAPELEAAAADGQWTDHSGRSSRGVFLTPDESTAVRSVRFSAANEPGRSEADWNRYGRCSIHSPAASAIPQLADELSHHSEMVHIMGNDL